MDLSAVPRISELRRFYLLQVLETQRDSGLKSYLLAAPRVKLLPMYQEQSAYSEREPSRIFFNAFHASPVEVIVRANDRSPRFKADSERGFI